MRISHCSVSPWRIPYDKLYDYTIYLQPTSYTFEPGHKAVLVITGWDPYQAFLDIDYQRGAVADTSLSSFTYAFNINNSALEFRSPRSRRPGKRRKRGKPNAAAGKNV